MIMTTNDQTAQLEIQGNQALAHKLSALFQRGAQISFSGECSILEFLTSLPGFEEQYIIDRVQTIFHNGNAVDDIYTTTLHNKDTLALSAAMPGLAGAIFRRGGRHASLRSRSSETTGDKKSGAGTITLKLFNMIARERGPALLEHGIFLTGNILADFFIRQKNFLENVHFMASLDGQSLDLSALPDSIKNYQTILLRISLH